MSEEAAKLFRIRKTIAEMLFDRGYNVTKEELEMTIDQFKDTYGEMSRENLTMLAAKREEKEEKEGDNQIFVFFADEPRLGVKTIKQYIERMEKDKIRKALLVVQDKITPYAQQVLRAMAAQKDDQRIVLEEWKEAELMVNITKHVLVPKHVLLTKEEQAELLKRYKLKPTQLPRIQVNDPVARYYGLQKGQVVKITRPSETAGRYVTYRFVV